MQCVDASVAAKWIFVEEHSQQALALLLNATAEGERLVAPPLLPIEVGNVIRQRMRRDGLDLIAAQHLLTTFLALPVAIWPADGTDDAHLHERALVLADVFALPSIYDAYYLALAEIHQGTLWTADTRLLRAVGTAFPSLAWIGDFA